ncbi:hypothetical protein BGW38_008749, partial [Lunasporangiospora selenospora]
MSNDSFVLIAVGIAVSTVVIGAICKCARSYDTEPATLPSVTAVQLPPMASYIPPSPPQPAVLPPESTVIIIPSEAQNQNLSTYPSEPPPSYNESVQQ